ncbi:CQI_4a_G0037780.mRNA.1.CDS.1 [Saccharomyces cerevisiae]|nr:CQI_4a_G0037780.mRNA.1.CDS.1 [Saccharomyces cerevisiae]CAI7412749.1 CQI_4a_G0037780.mRNA.1.CDS.1 [Saccharomyces cerevisiae]
MLQIPFDVFGLDCFNVDAFLFIVGSVFVYEYVYANKGFFVQLCDYKQSCLVFFTNIGLHLQKKGAAFGVSNFEKICVTLIVNELI